MPYISRFQGIDTAQTGNATIIPGSHCPDDLDTTSLALAVLQPEQPEVIASILDKMAEYVNPDGTILVSHHPIKLANHLLRDTTDLF